ncbi:TPA: hypothetical protein N6H79_005302, partial [Escherichia coli]|nr:hypothetical protein [Escherichia coli]
SEHKTLSVSWSHYRQIHNPRQDSRMLLATQHSATGQVTQWIKKQFAPNGILTGIYQDLLHREN